MIDSSNPRAQLCCYRSLPKLLQEFPEISRENLKMDLMDIDEIVDVPDTPDRLVKHGVNGRNGVKTENQRSSLPCNGQKMFVEEGSRDQPMIIDSGSRRLSLRPPKCPSTANNSQGPPISAPVSSACSSSSRNGNLLRKVVIEKKQSYLTHDSVHKRMEPMRTPYTEKSSSYSQDNGNNLADFQKRSGLPNGASSSSHELSNSANLSHGGNEETRGSAGRGDLNIAFGEGALSVGNLMKKPGFSPNLVAPHRVNKQKKLVRNGCISPNNTAKVNQLVVKDINRPVEVAQSNGSMVSNAPPVSIEIRELVAEDNDPHRRKGKGVISHPCSSRRPDWETKNLHTGSSMSSKEKAIETAVYNGGAGQSIEESGAWRSTRKRTREMDNKSSPDKGRYSTREGVTPELSVQPHEKWLDGSGKGTITNGDNHSEDPDITSSENFRVQTLTGPVSHSRARLGRNGLRAAPDTLIKRQRQGSRLSSYGECSTSISDEREVVLLSSPTEAANLRSTSTHNIPQIIEVDESPSQRRREDHDEHDKARQVEADELLARELQEQLYNEIPAFGVGEVNEPLALQHQDGLNRVTSRGRQQAVDALRLVSNLHRQSQSRSSSNAPRRGSLAQTSRLGRMARLRGRFPGQPRTLSSARGRTSMFPPDMDIDMRMHILGALEEFSDMGITPPALHANRDFNEDDYEMLLALDDNIDHCGASVHQINGLPLSTAQCDFDEACAVCLDTPTTGDTIRHLPCLHKFHKDCIDPWLRRKTSCPVCKSSIT